MTMDIRLQEQAQNNLIELVAEAQYLIDHIKVNELNIKYYTERMFDIKMKTAETLLIYNEFLEENRLLKIQIGKLEKKS